MLRETYRDGKWESPRILDKLESTQQFYFDRVSQIKMESWSRGRIALVGDAAFCVSLLAGQGSALAMISAYVWPASSPRPAGHHEEAFVKYEAILRAYISKKQRAAERFAGSLLQGPNGA